MDSEITPEQCRVARAILTWSQAQLAEQADLSERTVREFELAGAGSRKTVRLILQTFDQAGVVFLEPDDKGRVGLRWKA